MEGPKKNIIAKVITAATAGATSSALELWRHPCASGLHTVHTQFTVVGGSVTVLAVSLQGSYDGTNYVVIQSDSYAAGDISAGGKGFAVEAFYPYIKVSFTVTKTGTLSLDAWYANEARA